MDCCRPCAASSCAGLGFSYLRNQVATWREQDEHLVEWSPKKWFLGKTTVRLPRQFLALFCIFLHYLGSNINDLREVRKFGTQGSQVQILPLRPEIPRGFCLFSRALSRSTTETRRVASCARNGSRPKRILPDRQAGNDVRPDRAGDCRPGNRRLKKTRPKVLRPGSWSLFQKRISPWERALFVRSRTSTGHYLRLCK